MLGELASCYKDQQNFAEAERLHLLELSQLTERPEDNKRAIAAGETCGWQCVSHTEIECLVATVLHDLAGIHKSSGRIEEAIETYERALAVMRDDPLHDPLGLSASK